MTKFIYFIFCFLLFLLASEPAFAIGSIIASVIAAIITSAVSAAVVAFTGSAILAAIASAVVVGGLSSLLAKKQKRARFGGSALSSRASGFTHNNKDSAFPRVKVYGEVRLGGSYANIGSNTKTTGKNIFTADYVFADHYCYDMFDLWIEEEPIIRFTGRTQDVNRWAADTSGPFNTIYNMANNTSIQALDYGENYDFFLYNNEFTNPVEVKDGEETLFFFKNMSGIRGNLTFNENTYPNGVPNLSCYLKGSRVPDITNNNNPIYSDNPALCIYDYLTTSQNALVPGLGIAPDRIDINSFIQAKNDCDDEINVIDLNYIGREVTAGEDLVDIPGVQDNFSEIELALPIDINNGGYGQVYQATASQLNKFRNCPFNTGDKVVLYPSTITTQGQFTPTWITSNISISDTPIAHSIAVSNAGYVYFPSFGASRGRFYQLNDDGTALVNTTGTRFNLNTQNDKTTGSCCVGNTLYCADESGHIYLYNLNPSDGTVTYNRTIAIDNSSENLRTSRGNLPRASRIRGIHIQTGFAFIVYWDSHNVFIRRIGSQASTRGVANIDTQVGGFQSITVDDNNVMYLAGFSQVKRFLLQGGGTDSNPFTLTRLTGTFTALENGMAFRDKFIYFTQDGRGQERFRIRQIKETSTSTRAGVSADNLIVKYCHVIQHKFATNERIKDGTRFAAGWMLQFHDTRQEALDARANQYNGDVLNWNVLTVTDIPTTIAIAKIAEPRYTCNGVLDSSQSVSDNLDDLLTSCAGHLIYNNGIWSLRVGKQRNLSNLPEFTEDDIVSPIIINTAIPKRDRFNQVQGVYVTPANEDQVSNYETVSSTAEVIEADGGQEIPINYDLPFTNSKVMANRLARIVLRQGRLKLAINADFSLKALSLKVGDLIAITNSRTGWFQRVFEVQETTIKQEEIGNNLHTFINLGLLEFNNSIYLDTRLVNAIDFDDYGLIANDPITDRLDFDLISVAPTLSEDYGRVNL